MLNRELFSQGSRKEEEGLDTLLRNEGGKSVCAYSGFTDVMAD